MEIEAPGQPAPSFVVEDDLLSAIMQERADIPLQERFHRIESILSAFLSSTAVSFEQQEIQLGREFFCLRNNATEPKYLTIDIFQIQYITDQKSQPMRAKVC